MEPIQWIGSLWGWFLFDQYSCCLYVLWQWISSELNSLFMLGVVFETCIFLLFFFFFFWKGKSLLILNLFILEYLDQIPPWKEMKEAFQSRSRLKIYLCLRLKLNKTQTIQIRKYNTISKHIHQNIRAYTRSKKPCINQWLGKYCILKKMWAKQGTDEQV